MEIIKTAFKHRENIERIRHGSDHYIPDKAKYIDAIETDYTERLQ